MELEYAADEARLEHVPIGPDHPRVVVGRTEGCHLRVDDPSVSRRHCEFVWKGGSLEVSDDGSSSGTLVNGERIDKAFVEPGDVIQCGELEIRVNATKDDPQVAGKPGEEGESAAPAEPEAASGAEAEELVLSYPGTSGRERLPLEKNGSPLILGRGDQADVRLAHGTVSRQHCRVAWTDEGIEATDLGSTAGTRVNGKRIRKGHLAPGDVLHCGKVEVRLERRREAAESASGDAWHVVFVDREGEEHRWPIRPAGEPAVVGRRPEVDIRIRHNTVSRKHCRFSVGEDGLEVEDLGSSTGTRVGGEVIRQAVLRDGDHVSCGEVMLRVEAPLDALPDEGREAGDETAPGQEAMAPPTWHLIFTTDDDRLDMVSLGPSERVAAIGSDRDCDIAASRGELEPDHAEITWEEGVLLARDLGTDAGTLLGDRPLEEDEPLRNGHVLDCGGFRIRVVRSSEGAARAKPPAERSTEAELWGRHLRGRDPELSLIYSRGDEEAPNAEARQELTLWGDGDAQLEVVHPDERATLEGRVEDPLLDRIVDALVLAGFPDVDRVPPDDEPELVEIEAGLGEDHSSVLLGREEVARSDAYREAADLIRAIVHELSA